MLRPVARLAVPALLLLAGSLLAAPASATERHFGFTYESGVLTPGEAELEPWTTVRAGRDHFYNAVDQRLELELGLVPNLQTSLYWNFEAASESVRDATSGKLVRQNQFQLASVASEWKYKLSDSLADAVGSALYFEGSYGPAEIELEGKLIVDKQLRNFLIASNLSFEQEWELNVGENESEQKYSLNLAGGYFFSPSLLAGVEATSTTTVAEGELESSSIYAGPTLAYGAERYWVVVHAAPQIFAPKTDSGHLDLTHGERLWARVLLGFRL